METLTHQAIDDRSLALHRLVAAKLRRNPKLLQKPRTVLARWRRNSCSRSDPYLAAWEEVLQRGLEATLELALSDSELGRAMRQSSPLCGVLQEDERAGFLRDWTNGNAARAA